MQDGRSTSKGKSHPATREDDGRRNNPGRPSKQGTSNQAGRPKGS